MGDKGGGVGGQGGGGNVGFKISHTIFWQFDFLKKKERKRGG